jgi:hypothetical protein
MQDDEWTSEDTCKHDNIHGRIYPGVTPKRYVSFALDPVYWLTAIWIRDTESEGAHGGDNGEFFLLGCSIVCFGERPTSFRRKILPPSLTEAGGNPEDVTLDRWYLITPWSRVLLHNLIVVQLVKKIPVLLEPEDSLPYSKEPATWPYPKPDEFISHLQILLL